MIIISYDIHDDKVRTKFSKYICKYGNRIQYSVYEIDNSNRILENILSGIRNEFMNLFSEADSVLIYKLSQTCEVIRMGYEIHEDSDLIII